MGYHDLINLFNKRKKNWLFKNENTGLQPDSTPSTYSGSKPFLT